MSRLEQQILADVNTDNSPTDDFIMQVKEALWRINLQGNIARDLENFSLSDVLSAKWIKIVWKYDASALMNAIIDSQQSANKDALLSWTFL